MSATRAAQKNRADTRTALIGLALVLATFVALYSSRASAVPAYGRQTHQSCAGCHIGGFGPQLTPFGRQFKLMGYTLKAGDDFGVPLSAMLAETFTHTQKAQAEAPADNFNRNDNTELQQASVFLAGRLSDHLGTFVQATYSQNGETTSWDNAELRYANTFTGAQHSAIWGISLNNNPSLSDVFNTAPAWQYPYLAPDLAPGAPATPLLLGGLAGQVVGVSGYAQIDGAWYVEAGGYRSLSPAFLDHVNADYDGRLAGAAPYARVAYTWNLAGGNLEIGGMALDARRSLADVDSHGTAYPVPGPVDRFRDLGIDTSYQYLGDGSNIFTVNAQYVDERQRLDATYAAGGSSHLHDTLRAFNLNGSYWYQNTWGATLGTFADNGSSDELLYGDTGTPNTEGGIIELDWNPFGKADSWGNPWANLRVGAQYTFYTRFSGAVHNIDGEGRSASDNNTLFLYAWVAI